ncbi:MAG: ShlB/FhaC/HecB family hemolysin secretion/activation protein [Ferruginibacter sp.]
MNKVTPPLHNIVLLLGLCNFILVKNAMAQLATGNNATAKLIMIAADSNSLPDLKLETSFANVMLCRNYINTIPSLLYAKGYPAASVDSIWEKGDTVYIKLFAGRKYEWAAVKPGEQIDKKALTVAGFIEKDFSHKSVNIEQLQKVQQRLLDYYENNGYPFARIYLDSITIKDDKLYGILKAETGLLYHIDSIRLYGTAKINKDFLQRYLGISNGSIYSKAKLQQVSQLILELPYLQQLQQPGVTMLGTGAILNLYLAPKKSSQFNFLLGFLPAANQASKFQLTADVNLQLKNALGRGENILLNWQQLQQKSPRLNIGYQHPYIFKSKFGIDFNFDLFKKDSTFLQVNGQFGISYTGSAYQSVKLFAQWQNSFLLGGGVDTAVVKITKTLPANIDVSSTGFGLDYNFVKTDYRLNPRSGNEVKVIAAAGLKKVKRNNDILSIKDPSFNYASLYDSLKERTYQLKVKMYAAHYFTAGKQGTLKLAANAGLFSSPNIFRNELFQIGGYRLLRGFDEESIYATQYGVLTTEFRVRTQLNSYFFIFSDAGRIKSKYQQTSFSGNYFSAGLGAVLETKLGLLNLSYAVGKRGDVAFNLRQASKIHFGYINYF